MITDLLDSVGNEYVETSSVIGNIANYNLAVSPEYLGDLVVLELPLQDSADFD